MNRGDTARRLVVWPDASFAQESSRSSALGGQMREKSSLSAVGWVLISRREVAQAEQALLGEFKGVRDEVGLLAIHQAVSDRLFPGTSVLHTRLRYGLFVPWLMRQAPVGMDKSLLVSWPMRSFAPRAYRRMPRSTHFGRTVR